MCRRTRSSTTRSGRDITDWRAELTPHYEQAQRMLGVVTNPHMTPADGICKSVADDMGVGDTFVQTPVGVFFGTPGGKTVPDPYFGGAGPERTGCIECGECMTGCRHGAKNTLLKNYLGLAERLARRSSDDHGDGGSDRCRRQLGGRHRAHRRRGGASDQDVHRRACRVRGRNVGTQKLLLKMRDGGTLPAAVRQARRAHPHQLRIDRRRRRPGSSA